MKSGCLILHLVILTSGCLAFQDSKDGRESNRPSSLKQHGHQTGPVKGFTSHSPQFLFKEGISQSNTHGMCPVEPCDSNRNRSNIFQETSLLLGLPSSRRVKRATNSRCRTTGIIFRTADGFCNNVERPTQGQAGRPFKRIVKADYEDGIGAPKVDSVQRSCSGSGSSRRCDPVLLPSARVVSTSLHGPASTSSIHTVMFMQWGQFLNHDISGTEAVRTTPRVPCCEHSRARRGNIHPDSFRRDRDCFPIPIPRFPRDRFFDKLCLEFHRSRPSSTRPSRSSPRNQINKLTSFIDGSAVYGSSQRLQNSLRGNRGRMKVSFDDLLPRNRNDGCILEEAPFCFLAGDDRLHVYPGLTALHTAFVRYHNIIAENLNTNTNWNSERVFQETRKIVAAVMQKITYVDFLPELLSKGTMNRFKLRGGNYTYNIKLNPRLSNSFSTGAFRYGHSLIPDHLVLNGRRVSTRFLFQNPKFIFQSLEEVAENLLANQGQKQDRFMTKEISDHLFEQTPGDGMDLPAMNIQRGRDHGIPSYNAMRKVCGLTPLKSFNDTILGRAGRILKNVYRSINDIDLYTGGLIETPLSGSTLGPVFNCLIGRQFRDLKYGDSFWYETSDKHRGFKSAQLAVIREISFSHVLCEVFGFRNIQSNPFRVSSKGNKMVSCDSLPRFNLKPWHRRR